MPLLRAVSYHRPYYVDATGGSDYNDGLSTSAAWQTIAKVNAQNFQPGDIIKFKCGEVWREQLTPASSGASGHPITYTAYGSGAAPRILRTDLYSGWTVHSGNVYKGSIGTNKNYWGAERSGVRTLALPYTDVSDPATIADLYFFAPQNSGFFYFRRDAGAPGAMEVGARLAGCLISGKAYITIDGIDFEGAGARPNNGSESTFLVHLNASADNIIVKNVAVSKASGFGCYADNSTTNITYQAITAHDNMETGLYMNSQTGTVSGCTVSNNGRVATDYGDRGGIGSFQGGNITISGNTVGTNGQDSADADFEIDVVSAVNPVSVLRNYILNAKQGGIQINASNNSVVAYNVIDNFGSTSHVDDVTSGKWAGIRVTGATGVAVENNTIVNGQATLAGLHPGIYLTGDVTNVIVKNNLLANNVCKDIGVHSAATTTGAAISNNLYYKTSFTTNWHWKGTGYSTLAAWQAASSLDANAVAANPLFVGASDYHLQAGSPAVNAGVDVGLTTDYAGTAISGNPDIGAYER